MSPRTRKLVQYVLPTILSQVSFFLFTIIDGISSRSKCHKFAYPWFFGESYSPLKLNG